MVLPDKYLNKMKQLLGAEYPDYLKALEEKPRKALRINTAKISVADFLSLSSFHLTPVPWCADGFYYEEEDDPAHHPFYWAGLYYLQDASAMAPAEILPIEPGDIVLDGCCAPGGKALKLANKLGNKGLLVANDLSFSRQKATLRNLERAGVINSYVTAFDLLNESRFSDFFDKILLDVPCSGEGMFRKSPELISSWLEKDSEYYAPLQKRLLEKGVEMLKDGGKLVYSTCTFDPRENEEVILDCLNRHPEMELLKLPYRGFAPGILKGAENCGRLYPHKLDGEGQFVALLQKKGSLEGKKSRDELTNTLSCRDLDRFLSLIRKPLKGTIIEKNHMILLVPNTFLPTDGLKVLRSGLYLGEIKNSRFLPSQPLAMALSRKTFRYSVSLDRENSVKYLKGETVECAEEFANGEWILVCCDDYPLGWGKYQNHRIKNLIDPGWRTR